MRPGRRSTLLLGLGFGLAVAVRILVGSREVARSVPAGLAFGACLLALCWAARSSVRVSGRSALIGLGGGLFLCLPAFFGALSGSALLGAHRPGGTFTGWALVVSFVAIAEELFLRGALYDAVTGWLGETASIVAGAVAFAGLHVPLYGWHVVPLDLAVGLWLGALRRWARTPAAPAVSHTLADLLGWWLR